MRMDVARRFAGLRTSVSSYLLVTFAVSIFCVLASDSSFAIAAFASKYGLPCSA